MRKQTWDEVWQKYENPSKAERWLISERHKVLLGLLKSLNKELKKMKTLEVGCGFASNSRLLKQEGINVYCLDNSPVVVEKIKKDLKNAFVGDAFKLPFKDNFFELVFSSGLLEHFPSPEGIIRELFRVVKKDGIVINFLPSRYSLWQLYRLLHGKDWKHGYEENYTHKKYEEKVRNAMGEKAILIKAGGLDPLALKGFIIKAIKLSIKINHANRSVHKDAYNEIYRAYRKV